MPNNIDIRSYFTVEALTDALTTYKKNKTDKFLDADTPEYEKVRIPTGADGIPWTTFYINLEKRLKNIENAVLAGKYIFYPFREREIRKSSGKMRVLSIASIRDVLVQKQLYKALCPLAEDLFSQHGLDQVSFGYRPRKSIRDVARGIRRSYRAGYKYALDADIEDFFGTLSHKRLEELIDDWVGLSTIPGKLLRRFVHVEGIPYDSQRQANYFIHHKPKGVKRQKGVPQGGVLSGMLANLYMHEFDKWVVLELGKKYQLRYFRYADDFIVLTKSIEDARAIYLEIDAKLNLYCLTLHPLADGSKTKIVDISRDSLVFVGFQFTGRHIRIKPANVQAFCDRFLEDLYPELYEDKATGRRKLSPIDIKREHENTELENWEILQYIVQHRVNPKVVGPPEELCPICGLRQDKPRSWLAAFAPAITDYTQIYQLDRWMRNQISRFFWKKCRYRLHRRQFRAAGMRSMMSEYYRLRKRISYCTCQNSEA